MRVLAAMSGGVDSAVAAARAADAGHEVTGVHLALSANPRSYRSGARGCCTLEDARDARRAADVIGIPFYVWDMAERFERDVVADFVGEYAEGRTPNPCLRCNEKIKFAAVLDRAVALGFDAVCTGHHARLDGAAAAAQRGSGQGSVVRAGGAEPAAAGPGAVPARRVTKDEVRAEAAARGLAVADKPDSHDVCFIPDGDTRAFLAARLGGAPGRIVAEDGTQLGTHEAPTVSPSGSARGCGSARRPATAGPGTCWTSSRCPGRSPSARASPSTWPTSPHSARCGPDASRPARSGTAWLQLRAHGEVHPATARLDGDLLRIRLWAPARGVARGQAAVLYDGDTVLGSGTITATS